MGENPDPSEKKHAYREPSFHLFDKGLLSDFFSVSIELRHLLLEGRKISVTIMHNKYSIVTVKYLSSMP